MMPSRFLLALIFSIALLWQSVAQDEKDPNLKEAKAAFDRADRALNEAWAEAKKALTETEFNLLKEDQKAWVAHRNYLERNPPYTGGEGTDEISLDSPAYLSAAAELTEMRTPWLRGLVREATDETLTGEWTDSYGGKIEVVESEGQLHFPIDCIRGPTSHLGGWLGPRSGTRRSDGSATRA
jgi:uncharacterized protein YecT (DUF1311 family)